jgi:uncharacterized protein (DUF849 family)
MSTIITCAITGAVTRREQTPYLPVTPEEIANSALEAAEAGAAVVHIHVRNPETGNPSMEVELYRDTVDRIKKHNKDVLINLTTGPGALYIPSKDNLAQGAPGSVLLHSAERVKHIELIKPDLCSIDFNTMHQAEGGIRINHKIITKRMVELVQQAGTKPELEIFDSGDLRIAQEFVTDGTIKGNPFWQFAMGVKYGWNSTPNALQYAYRELAPGSTWSAFGIGKDEMSVLAQTMIMGGHVRVGLEDNIYTSKGILAKSNAELVTMAKDIIRLLGGSVASYQEAREILLK